MSISVNNAALKEVPQTEQTERVEAKNIAYRANPNNELERTPQSDYYDSGKKKKSIGIIAGLVTTAAVVLGCVCWHKGKPANGGEKKFFDRLKDGWKELWGNGKKAAEDAKNSAGSAVNETAADIIKNNEEFLSGLSDINKQAVKFVIECSEETGANVSFIKTEAGKVFRIKLPKTSVDEALAGYAEEHGIKDQNVINSLKKVMEEKFPLERDFNLENDAAYTKSMESILEKELALEEELGKIVEKMKS